MPGGEGLCVSSHGIPWGSPSQLIRPDRFWASVEPYCADLTNEEVRVLEELLKPPEDEAEHYKVKTPPSPFPVLPLSCSFLHLTASVPAWNDATVLMRWEALGAVRALLLQIPPLGKHYSQRWAQEDLLEEQKDGARAAAAADKKKGVLGPLTELDTKGAAVPNLTVLRGVVSLHTKPWGWGASCPAAHLCLGLLHPASSQMSMLS